MHICMYDNDDAKDVVPSGTVYDQAKDAPPFVSGFCHSAPFFKYGMNADINIEKK